MLPIIKDKAKKETIDKKINILLEILENKSNETIEHCNRVAILSVASGKLIGFNEEQLFRLNYAAQLHDMGKIIIPKKTLFKKERLTDKEWKIMKIHPTAGAEIANSGLDNLIGNISLSIRAHHESYNGEGYPRGLSGDEIPMCAMIIAICDACDAICADRPYNKSRKLSEALEIIKEEKGKQFNPKLVDKFIDMLNEYNINDKFFRSHETFKNNKLFD